MGQKEYDKKFKHMRIRKFHGGRIIRYICTFCDKKHSKTIKVASTWVTFYLCPKCRLTLYTNI